jgi:hypothetical protein
MATFTAREKQPLYPVEDLTPEKITEPLCKFSDGTSINHFYHRSKTDTVEMVTAPGFFNFMRDSFRSGRQKSVVHLVSCFLGEVEEGLTQIDLCLVDAPSSFDGNVIMARVTRFEPVKAVKPKAAA